jgi:hypothetical protein
MRIGGILPPVLFYGKELESAITFQCTEQFTDTWTCGWELFSEAVYWNVIAGLE